jgi:hypothetical protein
VVAQIRVEVMGKLMRVKFLDGLLRLRSTGRIPGGLSSDDFDQLIESLYELDWNVYAKAPFRWTEVQLSLPGSLHPSVAFRPLELPEDVSWSAHRARGRRDSADVDCAGIPPRADELRRGAIVRAVYKAPRRFTALRQAVRTHRMVQADLVRSKNRWRRLFRSRGIKIGNDVYDPAHRKRLLSQLPAPHRAAAAVLGERLEALQDVHNQTEALLLEQAARTLEVRRLATAPVIAAVRAAQIVASVITPHRFRTKRQFWSYSGLGVVTVVSAEWEKDSRREWARRKPPQTRGLNRNRPPVLKCVFKGAALAVITNMPEHPLHRACQQHVKEGLEPALARLTLARRIAAAVLAMWKTQEDCEPTKHASQT